jgi:hypothetical protein
MTYGEGHTIARQPSGHHPGAYRVSVERDDNGWVARIDGQEAIPAMHVPELAEIEYRVQRMIWGWTGRDPQDISLVIEVVLPHAIQVRLDLVRQLGEDIDNESHAAIEQMLELGMSLRDVERVLHDYWRISPDEPRGEGSEAAA